MAETLSVEDQLDAALEKAASQPTDQPRNVPDKPAPEPAPEPKPAPTARFVPPDETEPATAKPEPKPAEKPATQEPDKAAEPPAKDKGERPSKADQLRDAYEKLKTDFATTASERDLTRKELAEFRNKSQQYEDRIKKLEATEVRAKQLEERVTSLDEKLRIRDYIEHPDFHDKFVKPVADALKSGIELVKEMIVETEDGNRREGTQADFEAVLRAPNLTEANRRAKELFGPDLFGQVLNQRQAVLAAERNRAQAVQDAAIKSEEYAKQQQAQEVERREKANQLYRRASEDLVKKYPTLYQAPEGDKEAAEVLAKGTEIADLVVNGDPELAPEESLQALAKVHHRAAAYPMVLLQKQRLESRVAELEAELKGYKESVPPARGRKNSDGNSDVTGKHSSLESQLDADLARYANS